MKNTKAEGKDIARFVILSLIGIFLYFIPISGPVVPVVWIVNNVKKVLGSNLPYIVLGALIFFAAIILGSAIFKNEWCKKYLKGDALSKQIHYLAALFVVLAVWFHLPPSNIFSHEKIGGQILGLSGTVMLTVSICGGLIVFILKSGIVEFVGTLAEPLMKPVFKLPGESAINCLSAYVVSAAVGVYMTDQYYESHVYNRREAVAASTCFATISVGYVGVLCSLGGINEMYGMILGLTFLLVLVMTAITVRIPPISRMDTSYFEGKEGKARPKKTADDRPRFQRALEAAALKSREFTPAALLESMVNALKFSQKIIAYMIPIVIVTLSLVHLTPVFTWLGKPIAPLLSLLGVPGASIAAPAVLLGFIEVSLPTISVSTGVEPAGVFFVVLLSICQIIFMTEAGNAMLGARFKMKYSELILIFLIRTVIGALLVAGLMHLLF